MSTKFEAALREMVRNVKRRMDCYAKVFDSPPPDDDDGKDRGGFMVSYNYYKSGWIVCFHVLCDEIGPVAVAAGIDLSEEMGSEVWNSVRRSGRVPR